MLEAKEFDCVILDDGTEAAVLEDYPNGDLLLEKEIKSDGDYPDYEQFASDNSHVVKITYRPK
ncbi:hypothetical protein LZY01_19900 [Levilactobacillus zymae]|uniref:Phage protein n=1 Tax=Levilactobacillus zymae TaxID=267363 RepID=A0ABQ0X3D7_9LACO|nr:hypothetical protein [Levilactobacillus zymae]QFR61018.1 hypothetical protein LZ395_05495 [Levilactobacillus zymae]GEO72822.1 hypothetical protein LZY01_19900 [Levilactobacillus zymae]